MDRKATFILESREKLMHINPWKINLLKELEEVLDILRKEINFVIAGYAADNASLVYKRKIDTIEKITKVGKPTYTKEEGELLIKLPEIKVDPLIGKSYIDLGDILDKLEEIMEQKLRTAVINEEPSSPLIEYYTNIADIEEKAREIGELIREAYKLFKKKLLLTDIIKTLDAYSPYLIIFTILFLYVDEKIDVDIIEEDGIAKDIIITPVE